MPARVRQAQLRPAGRGIDRRPSLKRIIRPAGESQARFLASPEPEVVFNSDAGGGKTFAGCLKAHIWAERYPGSACLVARATFKACHRTTMETYRREILGPALFDRLLNVSAHTLVYPNGSRVLFDGLDDPTSYQSAEFGLVFVDEIIPGLAGGRGVSEAEWETLKLRLRDPRAKVHQICGATNAGPPTHWVRTRAAENRLVLIHARPGENDANLPGDYRAARAALTGAFRDRYLLNRWVAHQGLVFSEFDEALHVRADIEPTAGAVLAAGVDFGFNHAFCALLAYQDSRGQWCIIDEAYGGRQNAGSRTTEDWARESW